jgi:hypothetical protein
MSWERRMSWPMRAPMPDEIARLIPGSALNPVKLFAILDGRSAGRSMLDHVSLGVRNIARSRLFYDAALRPLGLVRIVDFGDGRGSDYGAARGRPR